jgi:hypothetical protein
MKYSVSITLGLTKRIGVGYSNEQADDFCNVLCNVMKNVHHFDLNDDEDGISLCTDIYTYEYEPNELSFIIDNFRFIVFERFSRAALDAIDTLHIESKDLTYIIDMYNEDTHKSYDYEVSSLTDIDDILVDHMVIGGDSDAC